MDEQYKEKIQTRLRHFLKMHRKRNDLSTVQMAHLLGYTHDHYRKFETKNHNNRFISALEFLFNFAQIEGMDLEQFIAYFHPKKDKKKDNLFPWEKEVLEALSSVPVSIRGFFSHQICRRANKGDQASKVKFTKLMYLVCILDDVGPEIIDSIISLAESITKNKEQVQFFHNTKLN